MLENGFLSTGDLVKILGTTKNTLFHYDSMGLFSPMLVQENGYRAYSYRQLETFLAIAFLRRLGMPLKEIKEYMQNRTPKRLESLLTDQLRQTREELEHLRRIEQFLLYHLENLAEVQALDLSTITVEEQPEQLLSCSLPIHAQDERDLLLKLGQFFSRATEFRRGMGAALDMQDIQQGRYHRYRYFFSPTDQPDDPKARICRKPKGRYVVGYHAGAYPCLPQSYERMIQFAQREGIALGEWAYEEYLIDDLYVIHESQYVTRILFSTKET